jgi:hypothetical protein
MSIFSVAFVAVNPPGDQSIELLPFADLFGLTDATWNAVGFGPAVCDWARLDGAHIDV